MRCKRLPCNADAPCDGCTERWVRDGQRCHSTCPKWAEYVKRHEAENKMIRENRKRENIGLVNYMTSPCVSRYFKELHRDRVRGRK